MASQNMIFLALFLLIGLVSAQIDVYKCTVDDDCNKYPMICWFDGKTASAKFGSPVCFEGLCHCRSSTVCFMNENCSYLKCDEGHSPFCYELSCVCKTDTPAPAPAANIH
ncbi:hypothetical protein ABFX02_03G052700 [Erythranthe guttata]